MTLSGKKVGLFGGTFDPVHTGHVLIAELLAEKTDIDSIVFIPSARPPHKGVGDLMFTAEERLHLLKLATADNPLFDVSDIELGREGPSYTIDTLRQIKTLFPDNTDIRFIVGMDNLYEIDKWKAPRDIVNECRLIVARRVCDRSGDIPDWLMNHVEIVDVPLIELSSTEIRHRIRNGRSIRYQVPEPVFDAICHRLEQGNS